MSTIAKVREAVAGFADTVGKNKAGRIVVRHGYFYRNGVTDEDFANVISRALQRKGINARLVQYGDIWKPFRGGASVAQSSHFYAEFEVL